MRKATLAVIAGAVALALAAYTVQPGRACGDKDKASASGKSGVMQQASASGTCATTQQAAMSGHCAGMDKASAGDACAVRSGVTTLFKEAPGTRTEFVKVDGGAALVVTAAGEQYVTVVQQTLARHIEQMKGMSMGACAASGKVEKASACPSGQAGKMDKACAVACAEGKAGKVEKASAGGCCAMKGASAQAKADECPDWIRVLCASHMTVTNTATGVQVTWTTDKSEMVDQLRAAGQRLQSDLGQI